MAPFPIAIELAVSLAGAVLGILVSRQFISKSMRHNYLVSKLDSSDIWNRFKYTELRSIIKDRHISDEEWSKIIAAVDKVITSNSGKFDADAANYITRSKYSKKLIISDYIKKEIDDLTDDAPRDGESRVL
ncbi:hypothetical protein EJC49_06230 [Aquibium carbonis]|uniref:Uncharacterized protein n=1 Tax=Aquibium carbonis TaxID=2495581 RepID=A0A429Z0R7_9HYPH|nr:hypothetical protein [Aquibium carbonis]RST87287.1 hypothetical protein EJC49_06230 [Aquibium carbonis]